ncbi:hypothetical protein JKF63_02623 [Porcisia hertigi]|uniref:CHCH domain-containing protein n=1 Tax=Porcisia hertigi TaxID=2761500 RepID=A0A836HNF9_9TRYP|nr:hypothetical protein JKF63_02623 [Porcisia hertigi]
MANGTDEPHSSFSEVSVAAPETQPRPQPDFSVLRDEAQDALEQEKYGRARTHVAGLGHVSAKDVFRNYRRSWLTPFFGSNEPEPTFQREGTPHPCQILSREVHKCLEAHNNSFALCQTSVATFQQCLREFSM